MVKKTESLKKRWKVPLETGFGGHCPGKKFLYLAGLHAPPVRRTGAGFIHIMADDFRSSDQILQVLSPTGKKVKMTTIMMTTTTLATTMIPHRQEVLWVELVPLHRHHFAAMALKYVWGFDGKNN